MSDHPSVAAATSGFLDLPAELKLMVYEFLPNTTVHKHVNFQYEGRPQTVTLVYVWHPNDILRTCRLVQAEATSIVRRTSAQGTQERRVVGKANMAFPKPQLIVYSGCLAALSAPYGLLDFTIKSMYPMYRLEEVIAWRAKKGKIPYAIDEDMLGWIRQARTLLNKKRLRKRIDILVFESNDIRSKLRRDKSEACEDLIQADENAFQDNFRKPIKPHSFRLSMPLLDRDTPGASIFGVGHRCSHTTCLKDIYEILNLNLSLSKWQQRCREQDWGLEQQSP
jgi:hypothetical protein